MLHSTAVALCKNMLLSEINRFSDSKTILLKALLQDNLRLFEKNFFSA